MVCRLRSGATGAALGCSGLRFGARGLQPTGVLCCLETNWVVVLHHYFRSLLDPLRKRLLRLRRHWMQRWQQTIPVNYLRPHAFLIMSLVAQVEVCNPCRLVPRLRVVHLLERGLDLIGIVPALSSGLNDIPIREVAIRCQILWT